jgi:hypothetical protein
LYKTQEAATCNPHTQNPPPLQISVSNTHSYCSIYTHN